MDVLIVEPLEPEVMQWLGERHAVRSLLRRRRTAYVAGVGAATVAGVIGAVVIRTRRSPALAS